jgi:nucleoid-associated protein YgaU
LALAESQQQSPFGEFNPGAASQPPATERNDSAGFRAVTRPAVSQRSPTSPGATGADREGRFSLAAFNTQNAAVAAGKDDGEKHNSIIVQNGENYSKISKRVYGTTRYFSALAVFNQHRIPDPNAMRPGMIVLTPDPKLLEERYPQLFLDRQPKVAEPAGFFLLEDGSPAYRVGARETLSSISERFLGRSTRWGEIYQLNRSVLKDPNALKPGLVLALPEDATEVQLIP